MYRKLENPDCGTLVLTTLTYYIFINGTGSKLFRHVSSMSNSTTSSPAKPLKLLCLHGFGTNNSILNFQLLHLRRSLEVDGPVEWHLVDSQRKASGKIDPNILKFFGEGDYREWWNSVTCESLDENGNQHTNLEGVSESISQISSYIDAYGPFDAVVGFSQGSSLLGILAAIYSQRKHQSIPWSLSIHVSGYLVRDKIYSQLMKSVRPLLHSSIFIIGEADYLTPRTWELTKMYDSSLQHIFMHKEGHKFPSNINFDYSQVAVLIRK